MIDFILFIALSNSDSVYIDITKLTPLWIKFRSLGFHAHGTIFNFMNGFYDITKK